MTHLRASRFGGQALALACALVLTGSLAALPLRAAGPRTFTVDADRSRAVIDVGKSGAFSFAGHTHEVEAPLKDGLVHLDPDAPAKADVTLTFNAAALRVTGKGESASDVPKVQETMLGDMVLDAKKFSTIVFESTAVTAKGAAPALDLTIAGRMTIHGVTKPVTAPVSVKIDGASLTATGKFTIKQTDFGIKPVSVGGMVKVKDELAISFTIVARER
jgi:polyisoprenoid-binding protein YceI